MFALKFFSDFQPRNRRAPSVLIRSFSAFLPTFSFLSLSLISPVPKNLEGLPSSFGLLLWDLNNYNRKRKGACSILAQVSSFSVDVCSIENDEISLHDSEKVSSIPLLSFHIPLVSFYILLLSFYILLVNFYILLVSFYILLINFYILLVSLYTTNTFLYTISKFLYTISKFLYTIGNFLYTTRKFLYTTSKFLDTTNSYVIPDFDHLS